MPQVRCTQCGAVNDTGAPDYPFCVGCQDNLAKCGFCQWFDDRLVACTQPAVAGLFDVGPEATPPCEHHTFQLSRIVQRRGVWAAVILGFAAALFTLGYALLQLREVTPPTPAPRPTLTLRLETDQRPATVGVPRAVVCDVYNLSKLAAKEVRLLISNEFFRDFEMRILAEGSHQWVEERGSRVLHISGLAPGERKTIPLELIPRRAGHFELVVKLESDRYDGWVPLPITVTAPDSARHNAGGRAGERSR